MTLRRYGHAQTGIPFFPYVCGGGHRHSFRVTSCWFSLPVRFSLRFSWRRTLAFLGTYLPSLCIAFVTALCMALCAMAICMAWHITYLSFGGRWRCCCLCVFFMHDMQHTCAASFFVVITFACYGAVVLPMRVGLHCLVAYSWYISTVVRFVTYLFSPCLPLTALCLFC